jgi:uncharacterized protein YggT (Ycf19 family)
VTDTTDPVQEYERRAEEAEHSPMLVLLKIGRGIVWVVYALAIATAILLATAFFLALAGANPDAGFVEWVYRSTARAMEPFRGIFPTHQVSDASVLDFSLLFAALFYLVVALLVDALHRWLTERLRRREWEAGKARAQADAAARHQAQQQYDQAVAAQQAQQYARAQAAAPGSVAQPAPAPAPAPPAAAPPPPPHAPL